MRIKCKKDKHIADKNEYLARVSWTYGKNDELNSTLN